MKQQLTEDFKLYEFEKSNVAKAYGISNHVPNMAIYNNIKQLCTFILQPLREQFGIIKINSGYRSTELNKHKKIKGSEASQHQLGEAADIKFRNQETFINAIAYIKEHLAFDQLIVYKKKNGLVKFIHVSYSGKNRRQVMEK